ncbi:MAG: hypothetical protein C4523_20990 [Myxococcales bacterium]|nr:MAG: hypothetical protein C4523_20990 [Myxococcales bacterium]
MMKRIFPVVFLVALLLAWASAFHACQEDDQDAADIAVALADDLTDSLEFDDSTMKKAPPPEEHDGEPAYPQITGSELPETLVADEDFTIRLSSDFSNAEQVIGAVVWVEGAEYYYEVYATLSDPGYPSPYDPAARQRFAVGNLIPGNQLMEIVGRLKEEPSIAGESFVVKIGMLRDDGQVGNYIDWDLTIPEDTDGDNTGDGDGIGDGDVDWNSWAYSCTTAEFDCGENEFIDDIQPAYVSLNACLQNCPQNPETQEEIDEYTRCYSCCVEDFKVGVTERRFVECYGCLHYQANPYDDSEDVTIDEARTEYQDEWDGLEETASGCVR